MAGLNNDGTNEMITTTIEVITPELAAKYLERNHTNRVPSRLAINQYATDMRNNKWNISHQGVAFYEDGGLADGQHRMYAVIKSGCNVEMQVTRGLPRKSGRIIDQGNKRTMKDALIIDNNDDNKWLVNINNAAAVKAVVDIFTPRRGKISMDSTIKIGNGIKEHVEFIVNNQKKHERGLTTSPFLAALIIARLNLKPSQSVDAAFIRFQEICGGGATLGENELAAHSLRNFVRNQIRGSGGSERMLLAKATQYAFSKFVRGHALKLFKNSSIEELYYPIPADIAKIIEEELR